MLRQICLTAALGASALLATHVGPALLTGATSTVASDAHAADFTGRIKNVRIKKRRVGSGFKMKVHTESSSSSSGGSASVTVRDTATGEVLDELTLSAPRRGAVELGGYTNLDKAETVQLELSAGKVLDDGTTSKETAASFLSVPLTPTELGGLFGEATSEDGWRVRLRISPEGEVRGALRNTNAQWLGDGVAALTLKTSVDEGSISLGAVRQLRTATTKADLESIGLITTETTLFDDSGAVVDVSSVTSNVSLGVSVPTFSTVAVRETSKGDAKLVSWTTTQGEDATLSSKVTDLETGEVVLSSVDNTPAYTQRSYGASGLEFEEGESPAGYIYLALIDLIDDNGDPFGEQMEVELPIPAAVEGGVGSDYVFFAGGDGALSVLVDEEGYHMHVAIRGSENAAVSSVNVIFEEPFEGPAPLQIEVNSELVAQFDKWVQKGSGDLPSAYTVSSSLLSSEGVTLGTVETTGTGVGKVAGNGKGTKKVPLGLTQQHPHLELL